MAKFHHNSHCGYSPNAYPIRYKRFIFGQRRVNVSRRAYFCVPKARFFIMKPSKRISILGVSVALLICSQFVLSGLNGVELVTVLLLSLSLSFGMVNGMIIATVFSCIRCFIFGFYPSVLILYLIYYNLFALFFGYFGRKKITKVRYVLIIVFAIIFTVCFSLLDDIITPLYYGLDMESSKAYFISSITFSIIPQSICSFITVSTLFYPLYTIFNMVK